MYCSKCVSISSPYVSHNKYTSFMPRASILKLYNDHLNESKNFEVRWFSSRALCKITKTPDARNFYGQRLQMLQMSLFPLLSRPPSYPYPLGRLVFGYVVLTLRKEMFYKFYKFFYSFVHSLYIQM